MICKRSALVLLRQLRVVERRRVALIPNQATIGLPINLATRRFNSLNSKDTKPLDSAKTATPVAEKKEEAKKLTLWEKVKHEAHHYWSGTKLLGFEIKVATKLLVRMLSGYELTRREYQQLKRTIVDVLRLVPFSAFVLIPFAELLLPIALKIFPNLLPSTYESNVDKEKKRAKLLETRAKTSSFLRNTIQESNNLMKLPVQISEDEKFAFVEFFRKINIVDERPTDEQIVKVARLFKDDEVLDNLSRPQLVAMAKYMALTPFGTDTFIRYQIRTKLINVVQDDRAIRYEGVDSLSVLELKAACRSRGLKNIDVSPGRLRDDLNTWLELRLNQKIPSTLLILSSIYTYGQSEVNSYYDALLHVLSSIPDEVYDVAKAGLSDDYKVKLNILKEQQEKIQEEHEQEKQMDAAPVKDHKNVKDVEEPKPEQVEESKASEEAQKDKKA
ncbi:ribosome-binding protein [Saccharomycopsis crataegensis]|uniref:Ribosome-binding protein n=1 Tax=Saccharomycopsis crataegensis TaxID=43959 RepID=A0AAV5QF23_9ASCO|nr:ribosome-binding protein [Saccharomycopsis crataegensis]